VSLTNEKECSKKEPAREQEKSDDENVGDRRVKVTFKLLLKDGKGISHLG
jgi:hypothetical protein